MNLAASSLPASMPPDCFRKWKVSRDRVFPGVAAANSNMSNCQLLPASCMCNTDQICGVVSNMCHTEIYNCLASIYK